MNLEERNVNLDSNLKFVDENGERKTRERKSTSSMCRCGEHGVILLHKKIVVD